MTIKLDDILADRYQIRAQLSKKSGRSTFLAQDLDSQDLVIIKILRFDPDFQWDDLKLFEREALTLKNLDHPAIPKYLDYFDLNEPDTRGFALVQTYIDAPSLETIIKSGRKFSEPEVIELADRLLSILTYLHEQMPPVIHRDIKPSNTLLTNRSGNNIGDVYLVDFGSVQTAASKEEGTTTIVGTYGYIPLEQFGGQTTIASDLYSLGMTLIYLLTGIHPVELPQINGQVKFTGAISNRFRRWLEKMTQPHLDRRFDSDRSAQAALSSNDPDYSNFTALKPAKCKTILYRDCDRGILQLTFPKHVLKIEPIPTSVRRDNLFAGIAIYGCLISWGLLTSILISDKLLPSLFLLSLSSLSLFPLSLCAFIFTMFFSFRNTRNWGRSLKTERYKLVANSDSIYISDGFLYPEETDTIISIGYRSKFDLIIYNPGYIISEYLNHNGIQVSRGEVAIQPELQIHCGDEKYFFKNGLSRSELYWLGQELSDFLDLKLQVICPTPKQLY
jgi:serine/threonine protein kinase